MPPIRVYTDWNKRTSDQQEEIEPYRKYVFICEGSVTEQYYFQELVTLCRKLGLHHLVDIRLWEKTDEDASVSNPKALIRFAHQCKDDRTLNYKHGLDRMVIVFDLDIYHDAKTGARENAFREVIAEKADDDIFAVTNPSFELFLLLHRENAYEELIEPYAEELLGNRKVSRSQRYVQRHFSQNYGFNPKHNKEELCALAHSFEKAIREEHKGRLKRDVTNLGCLDTLTCNIGDVIDTIRSDRPAL